jgi:hypothetical protein
MLQVPESVWEALGDSAVTRRFYGIAQYQGRQVMLNLDTSGDVSFTSSTGVQSDASIRVVGFGDSLVPKTATDMLAPYGQEVTLFWELQLRGRQTAVIPMGVFRITGNDGGRENPSVRVIPGKPGSVEGPAGVWTVLEGAVEDPPGSGLYVPTTAEVPAGSGLYLVDEARAEIVRRFVQDWDVGVELADRFDMLERAKLVDPKSPVSSSMWAELQRLSLFPLLTSVAVPDAFVPAGMAYDERLSTVWDLAALAGAVPAMTRQGALTLRRQDRWLTETEPEFEISGAIEFSRKQSNDFYNYVWAHSDDNEFSGFAVLEDDSDPRSVNRAGLVTYEHSSPVYTSDAAATAGAWTILNRLLNRRSSTVTAVCKPQAMLLEVGDFGLITDDVQGRSALGEVSAVTVPNDPTQPVTVELIVAEEY